MEKWLVVGILELLKWSPFVRPELSSEHLSAVALSSQVDLLCVDLVGDVDKEDIKEVIGDVVWLEDDLDFVGLLRRDCALLRHQHEWQLLSYVVNTAHKALQVEVDWEGGDVLDLESFLGSLSYKNVCEWNQTVFGGDLDFGSDSCTLQVNRHHGVVREHDNAFFVDLLRQWLKLHHDWLRLTWFDRSHSIED